MRRLTDFAVEMLAEFAGNVLATHRERRLESDDATADDPKVKAKSAKEYGAQPRQH